METFAFLGRISHLRAQLACRGTSDAIFLLPVRRKWPPNVHGLSLWRRLFSIAAYDGGNFRISRQNQSSPGTTRLSRYKRRHISTSGTAQMAAERARLEPMEKAFLNRCLRRWKLSHFSAESVISGHNSPVKVQATPYFYFRYRANRRQTCTD